MITIVDYGVGNIASIANMLDHIGVEAELSDDPNRIAAASHLILPGVGAFDAAMGTLVARGLAEPVRRAAHAGTPLLGVCLGMQLLAKTSAEGNAQGLGLIDAQVERITPPQGSSLKVPHIGWAVPIVPRATPIFPDLKSHERFYFVHGYHMVCATETDVAATVDYAGSMTVAVSRGNIHGVQFHPEKSHRFGMRLLRDFAAS
jgi:imidazole glycerol-phosphate synthase subunit HisH